MGRFRRSGSENGYRKPARYSAFDLFRRGLSGAEWPRAWREREPKPSYEQSYTRGGR